MGIDSKHPQFSDKADDWRLMRDSFGGERVIKEGTFAYLPATSGMVADGARTKPGSAGALAYDAYLTRAVYPEFIGEAVDLLVSVMHQEEAVIELPAELEPMRESATRDGESLQALLRRINEQQLLYGRFGLLADFPQDEFFASQATVPHLVEYEAETIINWDNERLTEFAKSQLSFLVVNETVQVRGTEGADFFDWMEERRYRVFRLQAEDPEFPVGADNPLVYTSYTESDDIASPEVAPAFKGQTLDFIPFVVIGANDMKMKPDEIPLLGLARLALSIYRQEADYKQTLHMSGQDTLVISGAELGPDGQPKGEDEDTRVGSGAVIRLDEEGKAEYIGINAEGISEQRASLKDDKSRAQSMGPRLLESRMGQAESGEALKARIGSQTATLQTVVVNGAEGLEKILKMCAVWRGANPDEVSVRPNLDFTQDTVEAAQLKAISEATGLKAPLSRESFHKWLQKNNFTRETFADEMAEIESQEPDETQTVSPAPNESDADLMERNEDELDSGS